MPDPDEASKSREQEDEILEQWCARLIQALDVEELDVDIKAILALAGRAAHGVLRPAAPLTTFVVGYAAGRAVAAADSPNEAAANATETANRLCREVDNA